MSTKISYLILILLSLVLYLPGLFSIPMIDRDEAHFAQATRQMMQSGNYFTTKYLNKTRYQKSPGINWLQAVSVKIFSNSESNRVWPYRIPSFFGALASLLLLFAFVRRRFDNKTALFAAILLGSSVLMIVEAHMALIDACLLVTIIAAQGALWKIYSDFHEAKITSWRWAMIFWLAVSIGFFLKGVTLLVSALTIIALIIVDRKISWLKGLKFFWGFSFFLLSTLAWIVGASIANHANYIYLLFHADLLPKMKSGVEHHGAPPGYYIVLSLLMFFPGSLLAWFGFRYAWIQRFSINVKFLLAWIVPTWIFYLLMPTKLPQYVLPLYPAVAILISAGVFAINWQGTSKLFKALNYVQLFLWSVVAFAMVGAPIALLLFFHQNVGVFSVGAAIIFAIGLIFAIVYFFGQKYTHAMIAVIIGMAINFGVISQALLPKIPDLWFSEKIVSAIGNSAPNLVSKNLPLQIINYNEPSLGFLIGTDNARMTLSSDALAKLINHKSKLILINHYDLNMLLALAELQHVKLSVVTNVHAFEYPVGSYMTYSLVTLS